MNAILSTSGWPDSAAPASPKPVTMFNTPGGSPARRPSSPSSRADSGVCSAGLSTVVHPAASAGATFQAAISRGKFHGMICPQTPTGSRRVNARYWSGSHFDTGKVRPSILVAQPDM